MEALFIRGSVLLQVADRIWLVQSVEFMPVLKIQRALSPCVAQLLTQITRLLSVDAVQIQMTESAAVDASGFELQVGIWTLSPGVAQLKAILAPSLPLTHVEKAL